jgi:N-methylhydantoinase B
MRAPEERRADLDAQIAANRTGETRLLELIERFGLARVLAAAGAVQDYSERLARAAIAAIPDGVYAAEDFVDDNGFTDEPLRVAVRITVSGETLHLDFSGSAPQTRGIINSPLTSTISSALGAVALLLGSGDIPVNDGIYRPITIDVPRGSFLNPSRPVAVRARNNPCNRIYNVVMLALSPVMPEQVMSAGDDTTNAIGMGYQSEDAYHVYMEVVGGGWGACATADGADVVDAPIANCSNIPVESLETEYPFMQVEEYGMRRGSAGAGQFRGGMGVRRVYRILDDNASFNCYSDRHRIPPWGLFGGQPGAPSRFLVERDGALLTVPSKANFPLKKGDRLIIETAGGGGFGHPRQRNPAAIQRDLEDGYVTPEEARALYGVEAAAFDQ